MAGGNKASLCHVLSPPETISPQSNSSSDLGLHSAVSRGDIGSICYALLGGQPIDSLYQGLQPIHMAAIHGDVAIVEFLLHNGADFDAQTTAPPSLPELSSRTPQNTPDKKDARNQRKAKGRGSFSFLKPPAAPFIDSSAISGPVNAATGSLPMRIAPSRDMPSCISDADCMDSYFGATPLHFAVANGHASCAGALLKRGARADIADSYGNTPETLASACACDAMLDVFERYRCQQNTADDRVWIHDAAAAAVEKEPLVHTLMQLPSPDPSIICFTDSPQPLDPHSHLHSEHSLPVNASPVHCRIARSATSPLPQQNVSTINPTVSPCTDSQNILPRRHTDTAGDPKTGQRPLREPVLLSASSDCSWTIVDNTSITSASSNSQPSSSAPGRIVREQSSFYRIRPSVIPRLPTNNSSGRRHLAPGRIMCISDRQCTSASVSRTNSTGSRRERSNTDSVINQAWRKYLEYDDESARDNAQCIATSDDGAGDTSQPLPELWMWKQAAIAVRNRRSKSLSVQQQQLNQMQHDSM